VLALKDMVDQDLFICPRCASPVRHDGEQWRCAGASSCRYADQGFPVVAGVPALVDFEHSVLDADRLRSVAGASEVERSSLAAPLRRLLHPANTTAPANVARMVELLRVDADRTGRQPRILVVGGGTIGDGLEKLYADPSIDLVSFDVYASPAVQFIGDGHAIPLADGSLDGVIVQAVLEHVLEPTVVAAEIQRVLRTGGIVYADTPFLQQVHEGAYDFTRFTDSGHRFLFRSFDRIDSGSVAGAGTALRWSVDYFVRALTRSVPAGRIVSLCFFWLSYLDRFLDPKHSVDAASSVYFLGRKTERRISGADIVDYYQGGM
jgi:SAM-dependent methyltransferase